VRDALIAGGIDPPPTNLITIAGDDSTGKIVLDSIPPLITDTVVIDFTQPDTFRELLGFNSQTLNAGYHTGDNVAEFSKISLFLIHTDLVRRGILLNGEDQQVIADIQIDVPIGDQIIYRPFHPVEIYNDMLVGQTIHKARFYLTDQNNNPVNTNGENWSLVVEIEYEL
jgi:hypothetical protein